MANRLLISSLTKKLSSLEKTANFPRKPNITPSALYVQDVLNPVNLPPPGKGSPREFYLKEIHKRVNAAWSNMDPSLKGKKDLIKMCFHSSEQHLLCKQPLNIVQ